MSRIGRNALLLACAGTLAWHSSAAQSGDGAGGHSGRELKLVVILSRHGVRSPTWPQGRLDSYSSQPWPKWDVPPGNLTDRGYELVRQLGVYDRVLLAESGLLSTQGCADTARTYIWADTDQRTIASGKALAKGLFPGCPPQVHSLAQGENDALFHPARPMDPNVSKTAAGASRQMDTQQQELLNEMQHVLMGCDPKLVCSPARKPVLSLLADASEAQETAAGDTPLAVASSFAEDFLLEYAQGMPMKQVGWGKVDEPQLRRFLTLHSSYFALAHRTPAVARLEASNLLFRIERTLEQGVDNKRVDAAIGPPSSALVVLAGHDTNIAAVAALLGLHWTLDGRADDTPPGMQLVFELWRDDQGSYSVRVAAVMQTLQQLREMQPLASTAPPASEDLMPPGCGTNGGACSWTTFRGIAEQAIEKDAVISAFPEQP